MLEVGTCYELNDGGIKGHMKNVQCGVPWVFQRLSLSKFEGKRERFVELSDEGIPLRAFFFDGKSGAKKQHRN